MQGLHGKITRASALVREGGLRALLAAVGQRLIRVMVLRFDVLDVDAYTPKARRDDLPLTWRLAAETDVAALFDAWPDSREQYERHHEVYYRYGFQTWLLFCHAHSGEPVHFQVLITHRDIASVRRFLPWKLYGCVTDQTCVHRGWVYTFESFRRLGASLAATDALVDYCRAHGIRKVFGHRGVGNTASIRMAETAGFIPYAMVYQIQFLWQKRHQGLYLRRTVRVPRNVAASVR